MAVMTLPPEPKLRSSVPGAAWADPIPPTTTAESSSAATRFARIRTLRQKAEGLGELLRVELGPPARAAFQEAHDGIDDLDEIVRPERVEQANERSCFRRRIIRPELELREPQLVRVREHLVDPVALRVHFDPVAGVGRDEGAPARVLLHTEAQLGGPLEDVV